MQNKKYKILLLFCELFLLGNIYAQVGTWKTYRAYYQASLVAETPNLVFAVYDGSLLSYSPDDGEIRTYSYQNGLNDTDIGFMAYHPGANALVLAYSNANIDIFSGDNNVYNIATFKNSSSIQNKTLYNLEIIGDYAYLSTAFGIVVIDPKRNEIKGTYDLGVPVMSVCQNGDYLYAATSEGIKRALITSNLLDKGNWSPVNGLSGITQVTFFNNQLVFVMSSQVNYIATDGTQQTLPFNDVRYIRVLNNQLIVLTSLDTYFFSDFTNSVHVPFSSYSIDCNNSGNQYWVAAGTAGLIGFTKLPGASDYNVTASGIIVNSPKRNLNAYMTFTANKLIVTGGGKGADRLNNPGTLMVYENGQWYNFNEDSISLQTGLPCLDLMSVAVDPADPMHYFVGSWGEGLYEFKNNEFVNLYSYNNSSLQTAIAGSNRYVRVDGLIFDKNNNLYMVNGGVASGLSIFLNQTNWQSFYYPPLSQSDPDKILISRVNQKWFNFFLVARAGIMVLDDNGTVADASDDQYVYSGSFVDPQQQGSSINATAYLAMAEDQNGLIWVGTDNGPIYFTSPDQVNNGVCNRIVSIDQYGTPYLPLQGVKITSIVVDGGNRKWMGTAGAGVYVLDQSDPSKIRIDNYNTDNSLLLSNNINSIAINDQTGEVFIGTDKGLCSYQSEAIAGKPDYSKVYAYPNPVKPASGNSQVVITGLMQNSTVKITDLAGNLIQGGASMGGQYVWNCTDRTGAFVKAGIYLVFAATPEGSKGVVTKIMVIK
jgi:hypothetical protein